VSAIDFVFLKQETRTYIKSPVFNYVWLIEDAISGDVRNIF